MAYAKRLTKDELIQNGIEIKVEDGHLKVYRNGAECTLSKTRDYYINPKINCKKKRSTVPYYTLFLYVYDKSGNRVKRYCKYKYTNWVYKTKTITLQRAVWAWYNGEVPAGYTVDHKNNIHKEVDDYKIEKLQLLTPLENVRKDNKQNYDRALKCSLKKPLAYFEVKLARALELYNKSTGLEKHKYNNDCARYRANIRYWKLHNQVEE